MKYYVAHWPTQCWQEYEPLLTYCRDNGVRLVACGLPLEVLIICLHLLVDGHVEIFMSPEKIAANNITYAHSYALCLQDIQQKKDLLLLLSRKISLFYKFQFFSLSYSAMH